MAEFVKTKPVGGGVWVAAYDDGSSVYIFATELQAYRFANDTSMVVSFWEFGADGVRRWYSQ
jgi:hypothetical protein